MTYRRALPAALALAAVVALPSAAQAAPVLDPLKPCYVAAYNPATRYYDTEPVHLTGTGFTPGSTVTISIDGTPAAADVPVDPATGALDASVNSPYQDSGQRVFSVTVTEQQNAAQTVTKNALVTRLEVVAKPRVARPAQRIRLTGSGFTLTNRPIYAHYVRRGHVRRTVRLQSSPDAACGTFSVVRSQFPFTPHVGKWLIRIDQQPRYRPHPATAFFDLGVDVRRRLVTRPKRA